MSARGAGYLPGNRWLVVTGSAVAVLDGAAADALRMWRLLSDGGDTLAAAELLVRSALDDRQRGLAGLGDFLLAFSEPGGLRVLCRGIEAVSVRPQDGPAVPVNGGGLVGWAEARVDHADELVVGEVDGQDLLPVPGGVVRASAMRWRPAAVPDRAGTTGEGARAGSVTDDSDAGAAILDAVSGDEDLGGVCGDGGLEPDVGEAVQESVSGAEVLDEPPGDEEPEDGADRDDAPPAGGGVASRVIDAVPGLDFEPLPPLAEPEPLPPLPPFVPAPAVLPPIAPDARARSVEETRYDVTMGVLPGAAEIPDGPVTAETPAAREGFSAIAASAADVAPLPPPITAVPSPARSDGPAGPVDFSAMPGIDGDHDGLTQLAEDLPIGYTPPPVDQGMAPGTVLAALCPSGHANAPHSSACRLCGQPITLTDPVPVQRPVLARVRLSTGEVVDLDRPVVLGRAPYASRVAASELPRLVTVPSPNQDISRAHVQVRVADWQVVVVDLDSTNGTTVRPPGRAPVRLHPDQEMVVESGWSVDLGDGVSFVIEALS